MLKIKDKVKTGLWNGIGEIIEIKKGVYSNKTVLFYLIKYEDNTELWTMESSVEKVSDSNE